MKKLVLVILIGLLGVIIFLGCEKISDLEYNIDCSSCNSCGKCVQICPVDAIDFGEEGKAIIDQTKCNQCGQCIIVCPKDAIY